MKQLLRICTALLLFSSCTNQESSGTTETGTQVPGPANLAFTITNTYPHDTASYTQGLQYFNGFLYEGTGLEGKSLLRKLEPTTGKVLLERRMPAEIFGEGITILNNQLFQLTWRNQKCFVYNLADFSLQRELFLPTQGWGITHDGTHLIISDGSSNLYFRDPATFKEVKRISVQDNTGLKGNLNELEYINGALYANVWQADEVLRIDPATGNVTGVIDFSSLKQNYPELNQPPAEVLNGIAYDSSSQRFFITGKNWSKIFEVKLN